jgi:hypothetical protein
MAPRALEAHPAAPETPAPAVVDDAEVAPEGSGTEDLWTLFLDASGQDTSKALALAKKTARAHLKREIHGLSDLTPDEVTQLARALSAE